MSCSAFEHGQAKLGAPDLPFANSWLWFRAPNDDTTKANRSKGRDAKPRALSGQPSRRKSSLLHQDVIRGATRDAVPFRIETPGCQEAMPFLHPSAPASRPARGLPVRAGRQSADETQERTEGEERGVKSDPTRTRASAGRLRLTTHMIGVVGASESASCAPERHVERTRCAEWGPGAPLFEGGDAGSWVCGDSPKDLASRFHSLRGLSEPPWGVRP